MNFGIYPTLEELPEMLSKAKATAAAEGNEDLKFCGHAYIVCGDNEADARKKFKHLVEEKLDRDSAETLIEMSMGKMHSVDVVAREQMVMRTAAGNWGFPLVGTPEQVFEGIKTMADGGMAGAAVSFPDYDDGIARYDETIRPLLVEAGLVDDATSIVTTVHPLQLLDEELPETDHDFRVDLVVTPDEVIRCRRARRPPGILWDQLDPDRRREIPALAALARYP
jgi:hypothetical protein